MKKEITYTKTNKSITVLLKDGPKTFLNESSKYNTVLRCLENKEYDKLEKISDETLEVITDGKMRKIGTDIEVLCLDNTWWKIPTDLEFVINMFHEKGHPFEPLIQFAINLHENPSVRSMEQLFTFLKANHFTITTDGCFIAYKAVRKDYLDIYTGTMDNSIGRVVVMDRNSVNDNPEQTCSAGLHAAAFNYACNSYGGHASGKRIVYVKINPKDVVSIPVDYNNQKMRVCQYEVIGECAVEFSEDLYSEEKGFHNGEIDEEPLDIADHYDYLETCEKYL